MSARLYQEQFAWPCRPTSPPRCLPRPLSKSKPNTPGVMIEMSLADRLVSLVEEGYDLVIRMGPIAVSDLMSRKIATLQRTLVASPRLYLAASSALKTPQDLKGVPALAIRRDLVEWDLSNRDGAKATAHPKVEFAANRQTILVDAAIPGLGVANLPTCMVEDALAARTLVRALPDWEPSPVEITRFGRRTG